MTVDLLSRNFHKLLGAVRALADRLSALLGSELELRPLAVRSARARARHVRDFRRGPDRWRGH